jgi:EAL domain-containing protein (putative c-di-GMP-specific phosphodiesterase class I)
VDHFGAGPTSLSRLRILPIDLLKIDREVFDTSQAGAVMDVTVTLGRRLGLEIIADGLENEAELDAVRAAGCRLGQGPLWGRPMFAEHLEAFLGAGGAAPHH